MGQEYSSVFVHEDPVEWGQARPPYAAEPSPRAAAPPADIHGAAVGAASATPAEATMEGWIKRSESNPGESWSNLQDGLRRVTLNARTFDEEVTPIVGPQTLVRLVYCSEETTPFDEDALHKLADKAAVANKARDVTGALVYLDGIFIQALEGQYEVVNVLYEKIKKDPRHGYVTLLRIAPIQERDYSSWAMRAASFLHNRTDGGLIIRSMLATLRSSFLILETYMQPSITALIRQGLDPLCLEPEHGEALVLVCGLVGVWRVPGSNMRGMVNLLGLFYGLAATAAADAGGELVKHVGENVFILFPAPMPGEALSCAKRIVCEAAQLCRSLDMQTVDVRAAISKGMIVRGNIGSSDTVYDYTLLGDPVNVSSRLCNMPLDDNFCVLIEANARDALRQARVRVKLESLEDVHLKGKRADQTIFKWQASARDIASLDTVVQMDPGELVAASKPIHMARPAMDIDSAAGIIIRLTYVSRAEFELTSDEVQELSDQAARNNKKIGVTGILLYCKDIFLQILEGPPDVVRELLAKIAQDDRHSDVTTILVEETEERKFHDWGMRGFSADDDSGFVISVARRMLDTMAKAFKVVERYTPPKVLRLLTSGFDPTSMEPQQHKVVVLVTDLVGFTTISESMEAPHLMRCINAVLRIIIQCVDDNGGVANKLVGDMVVAHFPGKAGHRALDAARMIQTRLATLRNSAVSGIADTSILHVGVGLAYGSAIEANIGQARLDFTLIGKCVEDAIAAESYTRMAKHNILLTREMRDLLLLLHPTRSAFVPQDHLFAIDQFEGSKWDPAAAAADIRAKCKANTT